MPVPIDGTVPVWLWIMADKPVLYPAICGGFLFYRFIKLIKYYEFAVDI
jgi:hypothetical protein